MNTKTIDLQKVIEDVIKDINGFKEIWESFNEYQDEVREKLYDNILEVLEDED